MAHDVDLHLDDVWAKKAHDLAGNYLGVVEAVGFRRGVVRRVGVPTRDSPRRGLRFVSVEGARLDGERLILPGADPAGPPPVHSLH